MKSNRAIGNAFEQELCDLLFNKGFWAKNLKQDNAGQPADVIAVRNGHAYLIDCKDCSGKCFDLRRVEDNQISSMQLWWECGNEVGWFAIKINNEIWMIDFDTITATMNYRSRIPYAGICSRGIPFERWVTRCR